MHVELTFPVLGDTLPVDHGYGLYAALSRAVPGLHAAAAPWSIGPVGGDPVGHGLLRLTRWSRLRCRLPPEAIPTLLPLAGRSLEVSDHKVRLGVPSVQALVASAALAARLVAIKIHGVEAPTPEQFLAAVRRRMAEAGIGGEPGLPVALRGPHAGQPRRRVVRVKGHPLVGFAVRVTGLSPEDFLRLQGESPFGRRRMGCGFFVPVRAEGACRDV